MNIQVERKFVLYRNAKFKGTDLEIKARNIDISDYKIEVPQGILHLRSLETLKMF